jgi:stage III sporulation protein AF
VIELVEKLCVLSVFFGLALSLMPDGTVKKMAPAVGAAAMLLCLMDGMAAVDTEGLAMDIARYRELSETLTMDAEALHERLDRNLIEQECQTYIENKAEELGLQELTVRVAAEWSAEGFWLPESVCIEGQWSMQEKERLSQMIESQLGIPTQRQEWTIA